MFVRSLHLRDFRNYSSADLELTPGSVVLAGPNGQGKTNVVEAINFLATLGSHRTSTDSAMIRQGQHAAIIRTTLAHENRSILLELQLNRAEKNKAQVNQVPAKLRDFPQFISTVMFAPEDLMLIRGEPAQRRRFLDEMTVARIPRIAGTLADYERVLKQRNTLLKSVRPQDAKDGDLSTLDIWNERLVELGTEIVSERRRFIQDVQSLLSQAYQAIAGEGHEIELRYQSSVEGTDKQLYETNFRENIHDARLQEIERGQTLFGPHRDDVELRLNGLPAKGYASHGETWSFALALKLAAARLLRSESIVGDPILILDDVFAELDSSRRERLALAIGDFEQIFITAAVEADVPLELMQQVFHVKRGTIEAAS